MTKKTLLAAAFGASILVSSCGRNEPPAVVQQPVTQQSLDAQAPLAAAPPAPAPQPVRESAWKPASAARKARPAETASRAPEPAPVTSSAPAPTPAAQQQQPAPAPATAAEAPRRAPEPKTVTLAAGSIIAARVGESLSSEKNETGDTWSGTLAEPLIIDGMVIAERGSRVDGRVTDVKRAGRVKGVAELNVTLTRITTADGQRIAVQTGGFEARGKDETKRDAGKVAIASGIGAAIGAIAGKGKGAAIGAGAGAAAGTGVVLATRGGPAQLPAETLIRFRVSNPVTITEHLK